MIYPLKTEEESMICGVCDDEEHLQAIYSPDKYCAQEALGMEYCISYSNPEFANAGKNRMSTFLLLADEVSVNLLGNSFLNEFIGSHKVFGIKKTSSESNFSGRGTFECPAKGRKYRNKDYTRLVRHCKSQACNQLKRKYKKRYEKNKNLTDKRLWKHLMEKLGKATARKLSNEKQQSTYILLDVPFGVGIEKLFFAEFKQLVFDVVERRIRQHYTRTKWNMDSYIPLDLKRNDSEIIEG
uniref:Protein FAR1-RELATED SEQUENCE n=1 Tax=Rhabditophanes sp. KR3021 TaxID=114890 RepID=A0AC35UCZ3_9BILA